ncbi:Gfo/Idh/MocA family oxidoreductase [Pikeienuella sp. HZG-20]|uniref:Gfo/Idh/MocA family protein n=1 Tax=Paludibacillus litoralis TaxID=3133267 RepID=UPI0030EB295B
MIRAGIVGLGRWGQVLVRAVAESQKIAFVRGVTRSPSKVADFMAETGLPVDDDYAAMLADTEIDAVVLATPHSAHVAQIEQAAAAGKHVYVEKPLALDADSAAAACRAAEAVGVVLALGHNRRFLPAFRRLAAMVEAGELGQVLHIEGVFSGPSAFRQSREGWRATPSESPAGGMTGKGVHITDLMIALAGPVGEVMAESRRQVLDYGMDDTTLMMLRFASGASGSLSTLTATPDDWRLQVYGSRSWAEIRDETRLRVRPQAGPERCEEHADTDIERAALEHFAACIEGAASWPVSPVQAVANTALLERIAISARDGARLTVPTPEMLVMPR